MGQRTQNKQASEQLLAAVHVDDPKAAAAAINAGADPNATYFNVATMAGTTALHIAAEEGKARAA